MKRISKYFIAFLFASSLFAIGCVKDNGNYDYKELPKMEISDFKITNNGEHVDLLEDNTIYVGKNSDVIIDPNYDFDESINPKYTWTMIVGEQPAYPTPPIPGEVLATTAKLEYNFTQTPGTYRLVLEVLNDNDQDFKLITMFNLVIESINGVAVLHTKNGEGDLTVFKTSEIDANISSDGVVERPNIFANANDGAKIENNPKMFSLDYHLTNKYNFCVDGGVLNCDIEFQATSMSNATTTGFFGQDMAPATFAPQFMVSQEAGGTKFSFMINQNKLYARTAPSFGLGDNMFYKFAGFNDDYFPYIAMSEYEAHIIFNRISRAFEYLRAGYGFIMWGVDSTRPPLKITSDGGEVAINDTKMDALAYEFSTNYLVAIMKDGASTYAVRFDKPKPEDSGPVSKCLTKMDITSAPELTSSSAWEIGSRGDYAFYSGENDVYVLNTVKGTVAKGNLDIPSDERITKITLLRDEKNTDYNGNVIFVSTLKGNDEGSVYQFRINPLTGRPEAASKKMVTGLGRVVDIKIIKQS